MNFNNIEFLISAANERSLPEKKLPEIAFAGKSNVGKSSVINRVLQRKNFARVGEKPGKTVHVNYFTVDNQCYFVDLPGYGYAKVNFNEKKRWADLMEGYFNSGRNIRLVVQLTDMRHPVTKDDLDMMRFMQAAGFDFIVVMTKSDKLNKTERNNRLEAIKEELAEFGDIEAIPFSAQNGEGADKIREAIEKYSTIE